MGLKLNHNKTAMIMFILSGEKIKPLATNVFGVQKKIFPIIYLGLLPALGI
jgi:hypothetical protein